MPPQVDIGILTIKDEEFRAVLGALPTKAGIHRSVTREYTLRYADAGNGHVYTVAVLRQLEQGNGEAQDAARDMIEDLAPKLIIVVGIAGGLPSDDVRLGDVVISSRIEDFTLEARKYEEPTTYSLSGGPIPKSVAGLVANLAGREEDLGGWTVDLPDRPEVKWSDPELVYGPPDWQKKVRAKLEFHFGSNSEPRGAKFIAAPIASSDRLVKDPTVLFPWITTARNILAVEMESGGVYRAARERCGMLAIRAISDIVGFVRSEAWLRYACAAAASFTRAFLKLGPVPTETKRASGANIAVPDTTPDLDTLYSNLIPLAAFPPTMYVAPATVANYGEAWSMLGKATTGYFPRAWALHNKQIYSLIDPQRTLLRHITDVDAVEEHTASDWAESANPERIALFTTLLKGALTDDLAEKGVRYFRDDQIFAFAGTPGEADRKYSYRSIKRSSSTITVVRHKVSEGKDSRKYETLRHLAFSGRFRRLEGNYFLEINPTYRFTWDGRTKTKFHSKSLSGIKHLEHNRAVLSQVRLWNGLIAKKPDDLEAPLMLLRFGTSASFTVEQKADEDAIVFWDVPADFDEVFPIDTTEDDELAELEAPEV